MTLPPWLAVAKTYLGVAEVPGKASNPQIMKMAQRVGGWVKSFFTDDDIPWCALFVNSCLLESGFKGTGTLAARDFERWGQKLEGPVVGAVVVFTRQGGGHVGFYVGQRLDGTLRVLGGNQSNKVSETWIAKDRLSAIRWPAGLPVPVPAPVVLAANGEKVSLNEA